jgi:hypothetical protein
MFFCPRCSYPLQVYVTDIEEKLQKRRHFECEKCGYHVTQFAHLEELSQGDLDRFYRIKKNIDIARRELKH